MKFGLVKIKVKKFTINSSSLYNVPARATHILIYAGKLSFGISDLTGDKVTKRGKFYKIPEDAIHVAFRNYKYKHGLGHCYGSPCWEKQIR